MNNLFDIADGHYTVVYTNGAHRTLRVKTSKTGNFKGKRIVSFMNGTDNVNDYQGFAFLSDGGELKIWRNFANANSPERLQRIRRAVEIIASDASGAGKAFALVSGNCYKCNRLLTNPESITLGIGPECAKKGY